MLNKFLGDEFVTSASNLTKLKGHENIRFRFCIVFIVLFRGDT